MGQVQLVSETVAVASALVRVLEHAASRTGAGRWRLDGFGVRAVMDGEALSVFLEQRVGNRIVRIRHEFTGTELAYSIADLLEHRLDALYLKLTTSVAHIPLVD